MERPTHNTVISGTAAGCLSRCCHDREGRYQGITVLKEAEAQLFIIQNTPGKALVSSNKVSFIFSISTSNLHAG